MPLPVLSRTPQPVDWGQHFRDVSRRSMPRALPRTLPQDGRLFRPQHLLPPSIGGRFGGGPMGSASSVDFGTDPSAVRLVQQKLISLGYLAATAADGRSNVDGDNGPLTQAAIRKYQADKKLAVTGAVDSLLLQSFGLTVQPTRLTKTAGPVVPGMKQVVVDVFPSYNGKFEGYALPYMYTDSKGFVTTGTGNLIDPLSEALKLPWKKPDGSLASPQEITDAWNAVKSAYPGVQSTASASLTTLRLDQNALNDLLYGRMKANHNYFTAKYPGYKQWPADAQLALHSIAWAWGPGFEGVWQKMGFPGFSSAVNSTTPDFSKAVDVLSNASVHESQINKGYKPRLDATVQLLQNANNVQKKGANPDTLFYPGDVSVGTIMILGGLVYWLVGGAVVLLIALATGKLKGVRLL